MPDYADFVAATQARNTLLLYAGVIALSGLWLYYVAGEVHIVKRLSTPLGKVVLALELGFFAVTAVLLVVGAGAAH
jgi:hypothetical protein